MPLKLVRRKRSRHIYLRGRIRGIRVFETTGTDDEEAAEAIRIKRESQILHRSIFGPGATVSFAEASVSYLASGGEARFLGSYNEATGKWTLLIGELAHTPLAQIGQDEIDLVARKLYPGSGPATLKRQAYVPVCAVLNHAAKKKWCPRPAIEHPRVPIAETRYSTPERFAKLLAHCKPQLRLFLMIDVYTGERLEKIVGLNWNTDIDLSLRMITYRDTKNGEMRTAHIPDPLLIEFAKVPEHRRRGPVFKWTNKVSVYGPLKNACKRAGVPYMPPHQQGRHTCATWLRQYAGLDLAGLKQALGWKSIQSVVRYAHVAPGEAARAIDMLPDVHGLSTDITAKRKKQA